MPHRLPVRRLPDLTLRPDYSNDSRGRAGSGGSIVASPFPGIIRRFRPLRAAGSLGISVATMAAIVVFAPSALSPERPVIRLPPLPDALLVISPPPAKALEE